MKTGLLLSLLFFAFFNSEAIAQTETKPNIILIVLDDLNDYVSGYGGHPQASTPNIQKIKKQGTQFTNAYCNAPQCTPSRFSFITGKDVSYTQIYNNNTVNCNNFRLNFTPSKNNEIVYTIPEVLKDSGEYYTLNISKIMACHDQFPDFDETETDPCTRDLSWSDYKMIFEGAEMPDVHLYGLASADGLSDYNYTPIPDSLESHTLDYRSTDTAIAFINDYYFNSENYCDKPFFLALGYRRPHQKLWIPEKYFLPFYNDNITSDPFTIPYNTAPVGSAYNGVVMPPQPTIPFSDFQYLVDNGYTVPVALIQEQFIHQSFLFFVEGIISSGMLPVINPLYTMFQRIYVFTQSMRANGVMAYLASIRYVDAQIGRLYNSLRGKPALLNNTIIVITSDHGYSLGEKAHWEKGTLYETDIRVPLIIADFRNPVNNTTRRTVSLIDLFPTILDLAEVNTPKLPDGSEYLDGKSLTPLMENPNLMWNRPVITTFKNKDLENVEGSCFPQYSIRDEQWHYMQYSTNGTDDGCNPFLSEVQKELYKIGNKRQFDPNEWENLSANPAYDYIMNYLDNFLPDSSHYLEFARESLPIEDYNYTSSTGNVHLYPNPANNYLMVDVQSSPGEYQLEILNATGQMVYNQALVIDNSELLSTAITLDFPSGLYILKLDNGLQYMQSEFVIAE